MKAGERYHKWVKWSEEDQVYIGYCPDLFTPIHGDDEVQVFADLIECVNEEIEYLLKNNMPLPEARTRPVLVSAELEPVAQIEEAA